MAGTVPLTCGSAIVVLSPHLDDAVLSCGALIMDACRLGADVLVVTVFNGRPALPVSPAAARFHARCGHTAESAMAERETEDDRALGVLGARTARMHLPEALYRNNPDGSPVYEGDSAIFVSHIPASDAALPGVQQRIAELVETAHPDLLVAPVGIGGHVDHLVVAAAARRSERPVLHYEDVPYALYDHCRDWRRSAAVRADFLHYCSDETWSAKKSAIECYRSQLHILWYSPGTWKDDMDEYAAAVGGGRLAERFWSFDGS
jgi:LmbE family N-acetylglucosaminyl deacetylase